MMSFDLYLVPLRPDDDYEAALAVIEELHDGADAIAPRDARDAAQTLIELDRRYQPFEKDYAEIARFEGISEAEARRRYDSVELNGPEDQRMAQFVFHRNHVEIHWYSGTTQDEMDRYLKALGKASGLALVDPQGQEVYRLQEDGEFR